MHQFFRLLLRVLRVRSDSEDRREHGAEQETHSVGSHGKPP
jgi:hypothetical protein